MMFNLSEYIVQAGIIGYLLVAISIITIGVVIERYWFWLQLQEKLPCSFDPVLAHAFKRRDKRTIIRKAEGLGKLEEALLKTIAESLDCRDDTPLDIAMSTAVHETTRFLWILELCTGIAPMFGILGTVSGIILSFKGMSGSMPDTNMMVSGISVSMLTTAIGLIVALTGLIPYNHLSKKAHSYQAALAARLQEYWIA